MAGGPDLIKRPGDLAERVVVVTAAVVVVESPAVVVVVDPSAVSSSPEPVRIHTPATMIPTPRRTPITVTNRRRRDDWRARTVASCSLLDRACF